MLAYGALSLEKQEQIWRSRNKQQKKHNYIPEFCFFQELTAGQMYVRLEKELPFRAFYGYKIADTKTAGKKSPSYRAAYMLTPCCAADLFDALARFVMPDSEGLAIHRLLIDVVFQHNFLERVLAFQRQGYVHGDLKPANILLSLLGNDLQAEIADFGFMHQPNTQQTATGCHHQQSVFGMDNCGSEGFYLPNMPAQAYLNDIYSYAMTQLCVLMPYQIQWKKTYGYSL